MLASISFGNSLVLPGLGTRYFAGNGNVNIDILQKQVASILITVHFLKNSDNNDILYRFLILFK